ncbi:MAG TPA: tail fiber protein [Thermoanaerobaculia bacterium]|nr:tail fiber protein [Thermoanaerobaculia bacterium]
MATLGEIRMTMLSSVPRDFIRCDGQLLAIAQNQALFSILGTRYGGDGVRTFALPDLRGRVPIHAPTQAEIGAAGGEESHALTVAEMPAHTHSLMVMSAAATTSSPNGAVAASSPATLGDVYGGPSERLAALAGGAVQSAGSGTPHQNMQPFMAVSFIICVGGEYPSRH